MINVFNEIFYQTRVACPMSLRSNQTALPLGHLYILKLTSSFDPLGPLGFIDMIDPFNLLESPRLIRATQPF